MMMNKILFVGDLHCQKNNLAERELLFKYIGEILSKNEVSSICFLGDIFNTHDVLKVETAFEVRRMFKSLNFKNIDILVGNHDFSTPTAVNLSNSVKLSLNDIGNVIDTPIFTGDRLYLPFIGNNEDFVSICNDYKDKKILICHQTFDSAKFENNFTAPNGVDQSLIPQKIIISGHIHKRQVLKGRDNVVFYLGTPAALNANEENENKFITILDIETMKFHDFSTDHIMKRFISIEINEECDSLIVARKDDWKINDDIRIYVKGTENFYEKVLEVNKDLVNVKFIPNLKKQFDKKIDIENSRESIDQSFFKYVHEIHDISNDFREEVWKTLLSQIPTLGHKK